MATFYQDAAKSIGSVEGVLQGIYKKMSKGRDVDVKLSAKVIEKYCIRCSSHYLPNSKI